MPPPKKPQRAKQRHFEPEPERFWRRRWFVIARRVFFVWLALPYLLVLVYLIVPPPSTLMLWGYATGQPVQRHWVPISQLPYPLISAVLTSEDSAFCTHHGVDFGQMERSLKKANASDKPVKATSTITQQTVKNLFFWQGRSWVRKVLEIPLSLWLELVWSKERILEVYLNIAQWGDDVYGVESAARVHFRVSARALSPYQSALLATSLPNPIQRNAGNPGPGQNMLTGQLLGRMGKTAADMSCLRR